MSEEKQALYDFIEFTGTNGQPAGARADLVLSLHAAPGESRTKVIVARQLNHNSFYVKDKPEDIQGPFAALTTSGGGKLKLNVLFIAAVRGGAGNNGNLTEVIETNGPEGKWLVRESPREALDIIKTARQRLG